MSPACVGRAALLPAMVAGGWAGARALLAAVSLALGGNSDLSPGSHAFAVSVQVHLWDLENVTLTIRHSHCLSG